MYNVLLIDDETLVVEYLETLINWEQYGFNIAAKADGGRKALKAVKDGHIDVAFVDIIMPGMDGLECAKKMLEINPDMHIILLTAHKEFEYARAAMELGINRYIMKSELTEEVLAEELVRIRDALDISKEQRRHSNMSLLGQLIHEKDFSGSVYKYQSFRYSLILIKAYPILLETGEQWKNRDSYSNFPVINHLADELKTIDGIRSVEFQNARKAEILMLITEDVTTIAEDKERLEAEIINRIGFILKEEKSDILLLKSQSALRAEELPLAYRSLERGTDYIYCFEPGQIVNVSELPEKTYQDISLQSIMLDAAKTGEFVLFEKYLHMVFEQGINGAWDNESWRNIASITKLALSFLRKKYPAYIVSKKEVIICYTPREMYSYFLKEEQSIRAYAENNREVSPRLLRLQEYIDSHYQEELSLQQMADHLDISVSRLSALFKSDFGETPIEYLQRQRINAAKRMMLETDQKIYKIAKACGYSSSQYFSQVFHKMTGMTPAEYRFSIERDRKK